MDGRANLLAKWPLLLAFFVFPVGANAEPFVGFGLGYGSVNIETEASFTQNSTVLGSLDEDDSEGAPAFLITAGVDRDASRTYGVFKALPYDDALVSVVGVSHDWKFGEGALKPFLGVSLGLAVLRWTDDIETDEFVVETDGETATSLGLGAQTGLLYDVNESFSVEAALRFVATDLETKSSGTVMTGAGPANLEVEQTVEHLVAFTIGLNYRF